MLAARITRGRPRPAGILPLAFSRKSIDSTGLLLLPQFRKLSTKLDRIFPGGIVNRPVIRRNIADQSTGRTSGAEPRRIEPHHFPELLLSDLVFPQPPISIQANLSDREFILLGIGVIQTCPASECSRGKFDQFHPDGIRNVTQFELRLISPERPDRNERDNAPTDPRHDRHWASSPSSRTLIFFQRHLAPAGQLLPPCTCTAMLPSAVISETFALS